MELLQLKYFCDAAILENLSQTAKRYGVPASAVSQSIRRLEKELGTPLFVRHANSISLNLQGREFYKKVSEALKLISDASLALSDDGLGTIKICINTNQRIVMDTLQKYNQLYPGVDVSTNFLADPFDEKFDLIISGENDGLNKYTKEKIISERLALAVSRENPIASAEGININELSKQPFVSMHEQSSMYGMTHSICNDLGFKPHIAIQSDDTYYVRKCVELGVGVAIVPMFSWKGLFGENVALKVLEGYTRDTYVYTNTNKYVSLSAFRFKELLKEVCRSSLAFFIDNR